MRCTKRENCNGVFQRNPWPKLEYRDPVPHGDDLKFVGCEGTMVNGKCLVLITGARLLSKLAGRIHLPVCSCLDKVVCEHICTRLRQLGLLLEHT